METSTKSQVTAALPAVIGGALGAALVSGLGPDFAGGLLFGGVAGGIVGLLPYFVGRQKDRDLAVKAVWWCVGSGMVLGLLLAAPVAIVFTVVLVRKDPAPADQRRSGVPAGEAG